MSPVLRNELPDEAGTPTMMDLETGQLKLGHQLALVWSLLAIQGPTRNANKEKPEQMFRFLGLDAD